MKQMLSFLLIFALITPAIAAEDTTPAKKDAEAAAETGAIKAEGADAAEEKAGEKAEEKPPKQLVENLSKAAFDVFISVKNPEGQTLVKKSDAKKLKHPLTTYEEREMAVARGYLSGYAKWCGLEWGKDYYEPYITSLKKEHQKKWTPYQYAYTEVLHGMAMGVAVNSKKDKKCDAAEKKRIAALAKK